MSFDPAAFNPATCDYHTFATQVVPYVKDRLHRPDVGYGLGTLDMYRLMAEWTPIELVCQDKSQPVRVPPMDYKTYADVWEPQFLAARVHNNHGAQPHYEDAAMDVWRPFGLENWPIQCVLDDLQGKPHPNPPFAPPRPFPAETGRLSIDGIRFVGPDGGTWDYRGVTAFLHFARTRAGEDPDPFFQWMVAHGKNVARNFMAGVYWTDAYLPGVEALDFKRPFDDPKFEQQVDAYLARAEHWGVRIENVCATSREVPMNDYRYAAQVLYDVISGRPIGHLFEGVNEPWNAGMPDPVALLNGIDRRGVLSAYGLVPPASGEDFLRGPYLDYGTIHLDRSRAHMHNGRDLRRLEDSNPCPWVDDEYLGYAEYDKTGGGARTTDEAWIVDHFAISRMYGGSTDHHQAGLEGRAPRADETTTNRIADGILAMQQFIPGDCYTGRYTRAGNPDFPAVYNNMDSEVNHGYASIQGDVAHVVIPLPTDQWQKLEGANGWRLDAVGPRPNIGRFVR